MNREEFAEELATFIGKGMGSLYDVSVSPYYGEENHIGIIIKNKKMKTIAPCYRVKALYEDFQNGSTIQNIAHNLMMQHIDWEMFEAPPFETEYWNGIRQNICLYLVNAERSKKLLEKVPHRSFLDLAIIYYVPVNIPSIITGHCIITNEMMEIFGMTEETLYEFAYSNTQKVLPSKIMSMEYYLYSQFPDCGFEDEAEKDSFMYILTNSMHINGDAVILYKGILKDFAQKIGEEKLCLMPSSVHEWIAIPFTHLAGAEYFNSVVREVNAGGTVSERDVLSQHCYIFDSKNDTITVA